MPDFIKRVAAHIAQGVGYSDSHAYAGAIEKIKEWAAKGNRKAIQALAQWEALRAKAASYSAAKKDKGGAAEDMTDEAFIEALFGEAPPSSVDLSSVDFSSFEAESKEEPDPKKKDEAKRAEKAKKSPGSLRWIESQVRAKLNPPRNYDYPHPGPMEYYFIRDVFPDKVIVEAEMKGVLLSYDYTINGNDLELGPPVEVVEQYVPINSQSASQNNGGNASAS